MPVKSSSCNCFNCGYLISDRWIAETHVVECRNGHKVEKRNYGPHVKCVCPRWVPQSQLRGEKK